MFSFRDIWGQSFHDIPYTVVLFLIVFLFSSSYIVLNLKERTLQNKTKQEEAVKLEVSAIYLY